MSRAQLLERAKRVALSVSLRALPVSAPDGLQRHSLRLAAQDSGTVLAELVAHGRRVVRSRGARRAMASLPPVRDARQGALS